MDFDSSWYAYQCHSGEILFHYNSVTGEHKWAVHFCSCLKAKSSKLPSDPCCTWQPVKAKSNQSGKFVRSIATETEEKYFSNDYHLTSTSNTKSVELFHNRDEQSLNIPSAAEKRQNISYRKQTTGAQESSLTPLEQEEPVEVVLNDPFLPEDDESVISKRLTLKLADSSKNNFVASNSDSENISSLDIPTSTATKVYPTGSNPGALLKDNIFVHSKRELPSFCVDSKLQYVKGNSSQKPLKRFKVSSTSSRKNPEPKKLKRMHITNYNDINEHDIVEENNDTGWEDDFEEQTDEKEEAYSQSSMVTVELENISSPSYAEEENSEEPISTVCTLCGKECKTPSDLTNHIMYHQPSGTKCPVCHKYFSRRQGLRYHVQTHAGDKPHVCKLCNKTFTKSSSLVAHVRAHSGIKPFKCPKCNKGFTHSSNLSSHLRIHSSLRPYRCKFCGKGFKTSSHLSLHLRCHSDERPYKCSDCGKAFKNSSHLKSHKKLHSTEKNVICESCDEAFKNFAQLMSHQRISPECHGVVQKQKESKHSVVLHSSTSGHVDGLINEGDQSEVVHLETHIDGEHSFALHDQPFVQIDENRTELSDAEQQQFETHKI